MRVKSMSLRGQAGMDLVEVADLSDIVVFAGPNGVGKTRILRVLIDYFRKPRPNSDIRILVEATSEEERKAWGKSLLDTSVEADATSLRALLQRSQRRNKYKSTVLNFESDRTITRIEPFTFAWEYADPLEEDVGWDQSYSFLRDRFQDVQHSLFKLVETQRRKIADKAMALRAGGNRSMDLDFPDPLAAFKDAFSRLLAPKSLVGVDGKGQAILYEADGERRPITTLSSGEREVVNIVFDFLLRNPSDSIVLFDEPELHLHPELSYKLLQTLAAIGKNNQFFFCTHSPEIITASIENSVVFVTPKKADGGNQAMMVSRDDATHHALSLLGQSIGIISLGKKLLLIEGDESSLDKQTYGAILRDEFPDLVLVPVGGKSSIQSFQHVQQSVLNRTIWGVEFFMLCDRDAVQSIGEKSVTAGASARLRVLPRYHLENYFLEAETLSAVFREMEHADTMWLRDAQKIDQKLRALAEETIPYAVALKVSAFVREGVGNVDLMPSGTWHGVDELVEAVNAKLGQESARIAGSLDSSAVETLCRQEFDRLTQLVSANGDEWKRDIPGRVILNRFAAAADIKVGRLKTLYLRHAVAGEKDPFEEVRQLFREFRDAAALPNVLATPVAMN